MLWCLTPSLRVHDDALRCTMYGTYCTVLTTFPPTPTDYPCILLSKKNAPFSPDPVTNPAVHWTPHNNTMLQ
jgi:hypothetical protein